MARQGALVRIAGSILIVSGLLAMVLGAGFLMLGALSRRGPGGSTGEWAGLGAAIAVPGVFVASLGLAGLVSGVGVWAGRTWARVLGSILAGVVLVVLVPRLTAGSVAGDAVVGSISAGYVLIVLTLTWRDPPDRSIDPSAPKPH